ncbi:MAG: endopeptidase La [Eubacteriales bacterium]|nr:endopeptidase La [Eubacteriales bacterium]
MRETTIQVLPTVALRGVTILPNMVMHFDINREKSVQAVEEAMLKDERIFLVTQKNTAVQDPTLDDLYEIGNIALVKQVLRLPKGMLRVLAEGTERAELLDFETTEGLLRSKVAVCDDGDEAPMDEVEQMAFMDNLKDLFSAYAQEGKRISKDLQIQIMDIDELEKLVDQIAINMPVSYVQRQRLLEAVSLRDRYFVLSGLLANEVEAIKIRTELQMHIKERIDENQKEYILREQLKEIREELGDDDVQSDIRKFREETEKLQAPDEVKEKLFAEIRRFENVVGNPSESGVIRGYIETLLGLPWDKMGRDNRDLKKARKVLEADHYGLEKVKERILEYLAVRLITKKGEAPILCLVGPPGTGKTSISKSIARALGRTHIRVSLGGVRDEAEIRGHRRTYIGAMPGRIAAGLHKAGVKNPLMLLDEIDKTGSDHRGDIASALLEVLDPEENDKFSDHYVELPIDLSEVLFVATANDVNAIPRPLLDRMELIEISSYTDNEKMHIAKEHLVPKQIRTNGLKKGQLEITDEALAIVMDGYTREAGVRNLERQIGQICRKTALKCQEEKKKSIVVTPENLEDFLGRRKFTEETANEKPEIGIVRGLAWTSVGGVTLETEVNIMPGKGAFVLTGQLGDVMKESAQTAVSYIRSSAEKWKIEPEFFDKHDIHIHIPEGAVPKDGPSAGITMASAMVSAITGIPARCDVAMTGEITLRGRVLPIGGLKEKLLAARKAKIRTVLVPEKNRPDVEEMDKEITEGLEIVFVRTMEDVLPRILVSEGKDANE